MYFNARPAMLISVAGLVANVLAAHHLVSSATIGPAWAVFTLATLPFLLLIASRHRCHRNSKRFAVDLFASSAAMLALVHLVDPGSFQLLAPNISETATATLSFSVQVFFAGLAMTVAWGLRRHSFRMNQSLRVLPTRAAL